MACKHERIKSVNCVIYCDICGEKLPADFLVAKGRISAQKAEKPAPEVKYGETPAKAPEAAKTPEKPQETPKKGGRKSAAK